MQAVTTNIYTHYRILNVVGNDYVKCLQHIKCRHENRLLNHPCDNEPRCLAGEVTLDMRLTDEEENVTCPACNHLLNQEAAAWK